MLDSVLWCTVCTVRHILPLYDFKYSLCDFKYSLAVALMSAHEQYCVMPDRAECDEFKYIRVLCLYIIRYIAEVRNNFRPLSMLLSQVNLLSVLICRYVCTVLQWGDGDSQMSQESAINRSTSSPPVCPPRFGMHI